MKCPVASCKPVNNHFDAADNNNAETPENQCMKESKDGLPEDFCLPESYFHHYNETLSCMPYRISLSGKTEKSDKPADGKKEYSKRQYKYSSKNYPIQHDLNVI